MVITMGIGVKMEHTMGASIPMSESGVGSDNWSMTMDIPVFWIPVSMAIVRILCLSCFLMKATRAPKANPQ